MDGDFFRDKLGQPDFVCAVRFGEAGLHWQVIGFLGSVMISRR